VTAQRLVSGVRCYVPSCPGSCADLGHDPGISFLLNGTTSPTSGNYTVILDDVASSFSAKSSFTTEDTLLFYASDLDPNVTHTVQVINAGGDLSLDVGGFSVFLTEPPMFVMFVSLFESLVYIWKRAAPKHHPQPHRHHRPELRLELLLH
jgi:hypothetical protein